tara:strand:+ start:668 stop:967 length:300 start_codon:yes stop_codon:yes gene_type:complete
MALYIGKYAFNSKEQAEEKIEWLGTETDEEGYSYQTHKHTIVELGLDGSDYLVDVLWHDLEIEEDGNVDHPHGWKTYSVDIDSEGIHAFLGLSYQDLKI